MSCQIMKKTQIRNAITSAPFVIDNGWNISTSNGAHNYIDVFEKVYSDKTSMKKATITLALDSNQEGNVIRLYICIKFASCFPSKDWQEIYFSCKSGERITGFRIAQRRLQANATKSGNAIHAILEDEDWTTWTEADLKRNLKVLRECCRRLCQWTDAYVNSLP